MPGAAQRGPDGAEPSEKRRLQAAVGLTESHGRKFEDSLPSSHVTACGPKRDHRDRLGVSQPGGERRAVLLNRRRLGPGCPRRSNAARGAARRRRRPRRSAGHCWVLRGRRPPGPTGTSRGPSPCCRRRARWGPRRSPSVWRWEAWGTQCRRSRARSSRAGACLRRRRLCVQRSKQQPRRGRGGERGGQGNTHRRRARAR